MRSRQLLILIAAILASEAAFAQKVPDAFIWPEGKRAAVSLSFDDARLSQADVGMALLDQYDIKATFYVVPDWHVEDRLGSWQQAVASGHEIGNHSLSHPCTGNHPWSRDNALEEYTLDKMRGELEAANRRIKELLGVVPETFAYMCGQTFVGRGLDTRSYVPLVAQMFSAGRGWLSEWANDPGFCDLAQVGGMEMDGKDFEQMLPVLERAKERGQWVVLVGHEIGPEGVQTTRVEMLQKLMQYAQDPANELWIAPVGRIARYILAQRGGGGQPLEISNGEN